MDVLFMRIMKLNEMHVHKSYNLIFSPNLMIMLFYFDKTTIFVFFLILTLWYKTKNATKLFKI